MRHAMMPRAEKQYEIDKESDARHESDEKPRKDLQKFL